MLLALTTLFVVAACSGDISFSIGGQSVDDAAVELIEGDLADEIGLGELTADCPEVPDAEVGTEFDCTATTADGTVIEIAGVVDREDHIDLTTRNLLSPGDLETFAAAGVDYPDSGYHHDVTHTVQVVAPDHPICAGLPASFPITDEVYLAPVFEAAVEPVLASTHTFDDGNFWSADLAIRGQRYARDGWSHPPGSNLVGWVKHAGRSPVAYVQFGDGADTYADPNYRLVVRNAIDWAASAEAHDWAGARRDSTGRWA